MNPSIKFIRLCAVTTLMGIGVVSSAQDLAPLQARKLAKDFNAAVDFIEAHPAPYVRISEEELERKIDSLRKEIDDMNVLDFYKLVSRAYSFIHDGHTGVSMPIGWMKAYFKQHGIFPYRVHLTTNDELFLVKNYGPDSTLAEGSQVLALNGMPVAGFLNSIDPFISYETANFRNSQITNSFNFYVLLAFGEATELTLTVDAGGVQKEHTVPFVSYRGWQKELDDERDRIQGLIKRGEPFEYDLVTDGIGLMRIHSFSGFSSRDFDFFLDKMMRRITKDSLHSLIIDVRGNTGGATYAVSDVMQRLTRKPFITSARSEMKVSQSARDFFNEIAPNVNWYRVSNRRRAHSYSPGELFQREIGEYIVRQDIYREETPGHVPNQFRGELYMLIDGTSFSAASSLAAIFRCHQLGLIVGTPTGGTRIFHANNIYKMLKTSKLQCHMATTRIYTPCFTNERDNVIPDLEVEPTIHHLIAGRDAALDYAVHLARKAQKVKKEHEGQ